MEKQARITQLLKDLPQHSNRAIAVLAEVDHKTVGATRKRAENAGVISKMNRTVGRDGRSRTATREPRVKRNLATPPITTVVDPLPPRARSGGLVEEFEGFTDYVLKTANGDDIPLVIARLDADEQSRLLICADNLKAWLFYARKKLRGPGQPDWLGLGRRS